MPTQGRLPRDRRARRRGGLAAPERLESRDLMAFTSLGFSLPDLTVDGEAGPVATYGGPIAVTVNVRNLGASSIVEPFNLQPRAVSTADAGPFSVGVYLTRNHRITRDSILLGRIAFPDGLPQNCLKTMTQTLTMPDRPQGFPPLGKRVFLTFVADVDQQVRELDKTNNVSYPVAVQLSPALPQLDAIALELPSVLNPGDTIQPNIKIANYGTVETASQAPVTVQLVASLDREFGPGDTVVTSFTIDNILPLSQAPTRNLVLGDFGIDDPPNVRTIAGVISTLPTAPEQYYLGLVVDPNQQIRQISDLSRPRSTQLEELRVVGPNLTGLPPAGVVQAPAPTTNQFPIPPFGPLTFNNPVVIPDPDLYFRPRHHPAREYHVAQTHRDTAAAQRQARQARQVREARQARLQADRLSRVPAPPKLGIKTIQRPRQA